MNVYKLNLMTFVLMLAPLKTHEPHTSVLCEGGFTPLFLISVAQRKHENCPLTAVRSRLCALLCGSDCFWLFFL